MKSKRFSKKLTLNKEVIANLLPDGEMHKVEGGTAWATCNTCSKPPYYFTCATNCLQFTCDYSCGQFDTCNGGPC